VPPLSHLTSCTLTKSNLYLVNSLAAAVISEPDLYTLITFQVPNLMSLFHCLGRTKISVQVQDTCLCFVTIRVFKVRICQHLDYPLSVVRGCLYHIFSAILHTGGRSSIRNPKTRHTVVTGTHLSWLLHMYCVHSYIAFGKCKKRPCLDHTFTTSVT